MLFIGRIYYRRNKDKVKKVMNNYNENKKITDN